jgi:hypothetical protein
MTLTQILLAHSVIGFLGGVLVTLLVLAWMKTREFDDETPGPKAEQYGPWID